MLGAGESKVLAKDFQKRLRWGKGSLDLFAIHPQLDVSLLQPAVAFLSCLFHFNGFPFPNSALGQNLMVVDFLRQAKTVQSAPNDANGANRSRYSRHWRLIRRAFPARCPYGRMNFGSQREVCMALIRGQLIEIIEWTDDSRDTLSYRFPDEDKEIKRGAQLIVRESQMVQFVYLGQYGDLYGPGRYTLTTDNIPVLTKLKGWKYGFETPFKAAVYYVLTRLFTGNKWGTANPVMMRDQDFGVVRLRAFGIYDFKIVEPKLFLKEVAGTDDHFRLD